MPVHLWTLRLLRKLYMFAFTSSQARLGLQTAGNFLIPAILDSRLRYYQQKEENTDFIPRVKHFLAFSTQRTCTKESFHTISFDIYSSCKYNINDGNCNIN